MPRHAALFYQTPSGREVVLDWIRSFSAEDRKTIGEDLRTVQIGFPLGLPLCRNLGDGLWEVRSSLTGGRIARVLFAVEHGAMVLLHGFIKKSQKTPKQDLDLALKRKKGSGA